MSNLVNCTTLQGGNNRVSLDENLADFQLALNPEDDQIANIIATTPGTEVFDIRTDPLIRKGTIQVSERLFGHFKESLLRHPTTWSEVQNEKPELPDPLAR